VFTTQNSESLNRTAAEVRNREKDFGLSGAEIAHKILTFPALKLRTRFRSFRRRTSRLTHSGRNSFSLLAASKLVQISSKGT